MKNHARPMHSEICCAGCGFRAPDPEFFRRERDGVLGRKRVFCLGCAPYAPHRFETASYVIPLCFIPAGALLLAFDPKAESIGKDGYWILFMGVLILAQMLTTVAHEFGHAALAHLMGMRVIAVTIGTGPLLTSIRLNSLVVSVHRFLLTGGATHFYDDSASPSKLRAASVTLGGILVNLFIVAGGLAPFVWMSMTHRSIPTLAIVVAYAALASQAIAIIENAWPREARVGHTRVPTDGRQLLILLRSKDFQQRAAMTQLLRSGLDLLERYRYAEAQAHFERASVLFPSDLCFRSLALHCVSKTAGPLCAVQYYLDNRDAIAAASRSAPVPQWEAVIYATAAWNAVLTEERDLLPMADELSRRALDIAPGVGGVLNATRGAALLALGAHDEGKALLARGFARRPIKWTSLISRGFWDCGRSHSATSALVRPGCALPISSLRVPTKPGRVPSIGPSLKCRVVNASDRLLRRGEIDDAEVSRRARKLLEWQGILASSQVRKTSVNHGFLL